MRKWFLALTFSMAAMAQSPALQFPLWAPQGTAISPESLSVSVGGAKAAILKIHAPADDLMLLVVLDLTDDLAAVQQARTALAERLQMLPTNHFVGVLSAQNGLRVLEDPTGDRKKTQAAMVSQTVGGRAGLLETIEDVARIGSSIIAKSGVRVAVLYVTDSDINNYREAFNNPTINQSDNGDVSRRMDSLVRERISRTVNTLQKTQVPIFISHLTYRTDQLNVAYQTGLISLASATGGTAVVARSISEISSTVNQTLDHILGHYSVSVTLPDPHAKKVDLALENSTGTGLDYRSSFVLGN
ncbi:MAG: hypothetical protein ABI811_07210 [Acidobacteriota bacterium]